MTGTSPPSSNVECRVKCIHRWSPAVAESWSAPAVVTYCGVAVIGILRARSGRRAQDAPCRSVRLQTGELIGGQDQVRGGSGVGDGRRPGRAGDGDDDVGLREVPGQRDLV